MIEYAFVSWLYVGGERFQTYRDVSSCNLVFSGLRIFNILMYDFHFLESGAARGRGISNHACIA